MAVPRRIQRARLADAALGVVVFVVIAIPITADLGGARGPEPLAYLFAAGLGGLMLVRRDHPELALAATAVGLIAYHAADFPPVGIAIPMAGALYSAAEVGRTREAIGAALALLVFSTAYRLGEGEDPAYLLGYEVAWVAGLMAAAIALGDGIRSRRSLHAEHRRRAAQLAAEQERDAAGRIEEERLRIARDVHDVLAHTVAVVSIQADVATEALADDDPAAAAAALTLIRQAGDQAGSELRTTVGLLRGADPAPEAAHAPTGSLTHLGTLTETATDSGLAVETRVEGDAVALPAAVDATAYRIIQEALTNCLRHAEADHVEVMLTYRPDRLELSVTDDGRGTVPANGARPGRGLAGMRERAGLLGGRVEAGPAAGGGFAVHAELPVEVRL